MSTLTHCLMKRSHYRHEAKADSFLKRAWYFLWYSDSWLSWLVNIVLAYILIKFIVYPALGWLLATPFPVVAVVSESMEHNGLSFDVWWGQNQAFYLDRGITYDSFKGFPFLNGFEKGDIMILYGTKPEDIKAGQVIVFQSSKPYPIIHRAIAKSQEEGVLAGQYYFETKGDNNPFQIRDFQLDETYVPQRVLQGRAVFRIPLLGYVKIWFVDLLRVFGLYGGG